MGRDACFFIWFFRAGTTNSGVAAWKFRDDHHAGDSLVMREKVRTCEGEKNDVEPAVRKIDAVDENCNTKCDFMVCESAITGN